MAAGEVSKPLTMTTVGGTGGAVGATTAELTLPTARVVHVTVTTAAVVRLGPSGVTVTTANGTIITPDSGGLILDTMGFVSIASIRVALNGVAAGDGLICVNPVR